MSPTDAALPGPDSAFPPVPRWVNGGLCEARLTGRSLSRSPAFVLFTLPGFLLATVPGVALSQLDNASIRDSAGITIVESVAQAWPQGQEWRMGRPLLTIGAGSEDEDQLFRVVGAVRLADGRIVIANAGTRQLRFYSDNGAHLDDAGGAGSGPGEFDGISRFRAFGDTLVVFDMAAQRVSFFRSSGDFDGSFGLPRPPIETVAFPVVAGVFWDSDLLVRLVRPVRASGPARIERLPERLFRYDRASDLYTLVGSYPGREFVIAPRPRGLRGGGEVFDRAPREFGRSSAFALHGGHLYVGDNARYEIVAYAVGAEPAVERIIRRSHDPLDVRSQDVEALRAGTLARARSEGSRTAIRRWHALQPSTPETMPAFAPELKFDAVGNLWVREFNRPADERPRWSVFDDAGVWLGVVAFPADFTPYEIGDRFVLGRLVGADEVELVVMYELLKELERMHRLGGFDRVLR